MIIGNILGIYQNPKQDALILTSMDSTMKIFDLRMNSIRETIDCGVPLSQSCKKSMIGFDTM
jgi:hypothetical protein